MASVWNIEVGEVLRRTELHDRFGGGKQGGMEPSAQTPNVFLFTEPSAGERFGYAYDGWHEDGTFHYTGEGQVGDQRMREGNKAARDHAKQHRALRLFRASGTQVRYMGEFELPSEDPFFVETAPDRDGMLRSVFVFRLKPVGGAAPDDHDLQAPAPGGVDEVPVESADVAQYAQQHPEEPILAVRKEAALVGRYVAWLGARGRACTRHRIPTPGGARMFTDLYDQGTNELIEAKGSSAREYMRAGLGQVLDYARFVKHDRVALLVPSKPAPDLLELLGLYGVGCIWEERLNEFMRQDAPTV